MKKILLGFILLTLTITFNVNAKEETLHKKEEPKVDINKIKPKKDDISISKYEEEYLIAKKDLLERNKDFYKLDSEGKYKILLDDYKRNLCFDYLPSLPPIKEDLINKEKEVKLLEKSIKKAISDTKSFYERKRVEDMQNFKKEFLKRYKLEESKNVKEIEQLLNDMIKESK
jgi:hypothetical protein